MPMSCSMEYHAMDDTALIERIGKKRYRRRLERDRYYTQAIDRNDLPSSSPPVIMTTTGPVSGSKLAQEIHDEFLTCKICLEGFKAPKCLDCLHTFCEQCIENHVMSECTYKKYSDYREFTCPLCRKRTALPIGGVKKLPDNFLVSSLSEVVQRQKPSKFPFCDICKLVNRKHREATSKCLDCNKLLCKQCVDMHKETKVTKGHSLFDVEIEKDIECKEHQEEVVRFYCEPCETCICVLCTFNEHKDHEITQFSEAVMKYKESIQSLLNNCKARITCYDSQLALLAKCDTMVKAAEQKIRDVAIQFIADIRTKEKQLIENLHELYGAELMEYISRRSEMQVNLDSLKSTCNLTEIVLKGKDIELLLLKKQVQEKLSCLNDIQLKELPRSVHRQISFTPGSLTLGTLEDLESPAGKLAAQRSVSFGDGLHIRTTETQTDWDPPKPKGKNVERGMQTIPVVRDAPISLPPSQQTASQDDKATATESVPTTEKAVNTRSRSLQALTHQLQQTPSKEEAPPSPDVAVPEGDPHAAVRRRHRRRERPRPVEVSVRPTTNSAAPHHVLTYSSSIEESYFSPDTAPTSPSP